MFLIVGVVEEGNQSLKLIVASSYLTAYDLDEYLLTLVNNSPVVFAPHFSDFEILVLHHCRLVIGRFRMEQLLRYLHIIEEFLVLVCFTIIE